MDIADGIQVLNNVAGQQDLLVWTKTAMKDINKGDIVRWQKQQVSRWRAVEYWMGLVLTQPEKSERHDSGVMDVRTNDGYNTHKISTCASWDDAFTFEVCSVPGEEVKSG